MQFNWNKQSQPLPKEVRTLLDFELNEIRKAADKRIDEVIARLTGEVKSASDNFASELNRLKEDFNNLRFSFQRLEDQYKELEKTAAQLQTKSKSWKDELNQSRKEYDKNNKTLDDRLKALETTYGSQNNQIISLLQRLVQEPDGNVVQPQVTVEQDPRYIQSHNASSSQLAQVTSGSLPTRSISVKAAELGPTGKLKGILWIVREQYKKFDYVFENTRKKMPSSQSNAVVYSKSAADLKIIQPYEYIVYMSSFFGTHLSNIDIEFLEKISELSNSRSIGLFYLRQDVTPDVDVTLNNASLYFFHFNERTGLIGSTYNNQLHSKLANELKL